MAAKVTPGGCRDRVVHVPLTKRHLMRHVRNRLPTHLYDTTDSASDGTAVYTLSDPREIRVTRYVGQTRAPRRRFMQHVATARLWIPDETPWWIQSPRLRPLYEWIRVLHRDEHRLPVMVVTEWIAGDRDARAAERELILRCLRERLPLLFCEARLPGDQLQLL